ncbi:MAG: hypothetical protein LBM00_03755 [Deltaproteobacteria bacterium]|jgi:hypothetical protein|nr:hypothetical protein [Deltaproteobacteria bacterium]
MQEILKEKLRDMDVPGFAPKFTPEEFEAAGLDFVEDAMDLEDIDEMANDPDVV